MKPQPGTALGGRYRLVRQIAVGGMGEVWVAKDESLARDIAVKVLKEEFVGNNDFLNRFRVEARNAASLSHAHIAQLYDYGEQDGSAYLVMELVHGEPMSDLLEREPVLPVGKLLTILSQTSRALHAAHVGGVVHRDIKPGNIIIETSGDVKITDFGVSLAANQVPMTAAGMVMGTAQYLSPEQAIGRAATGASDIYALGIVAYEAVVGNRPFTGKTPVDIAVAHVNEPVPPLPKNVNKELAALIMRMLAKDPLERPRSGAALAHTFEGIAKEIEAEAARYYARPTANSQLDSTLGAALAPSRASDVIDEGGPRLGQQQPLQPSGHGAPASKTTPPSRAPHPNAQQPMLDVEQTRVAPRRAQQPQHNGAPQQQPGLPPQQFPGPTHGSRAQYGGTQPAQRTEQRPRNYATPQRNPHNASQPTRRQAPAPQPRTSLIERIKALGPIGFALIGVIIAILLATMIKSVVSAPDEQHTVNTVAGKYSSVEFSVSANKGLAAVTNREDAPSQGKIAQSIKDA